MKKFILVLFILFLSAATSHATPVFQDNFEDGDLYDQWTPKTTSSYAELRTDPLDGGNTALSFRLSNSGGDIFTSDPLFAAGDYVLSFDYYGDSSLGVNGGYVGISQDFPGSHEWLWATGTVSGAVAVLTNNSSWGFYSFTFSVPYDFHLMFEDYGGGGYRAFFDNIELASVPEPATMLLLGTGLVGFAGFRRKFKKP